MEEQPEAPGRADKACLQEAELLVIGREQLQAGLAPAGGPRGLPDGSQLGLYLSQGHNRLVKSASGAYVAMMLHGVGIQLKFLM